MDYIKSKGVWEEIDVPYIKTRPETGLAPALPMHGFKAGGHTASKPEITSHGPDWFVYKDTTVAYKGMMVSWTLDRPAPPIGHKTQLTFDLVRGQHLKDFTFNILRHKFPLGDKPDSTYSIMLDSALVNHMVYFTFLSSFGGDFEIRNIKFQDVIMDMTKPATWHESDAEFIKVGGHWSKIGQLSDTKLDYDMTVATEADSTRYLVEKNDPATHKAIMYSGTSADVKQTNMVIMPIDAHEVTNDIWKESPHNSFRGGSNVTVTSTVLGEYKITEVKGADPKNSSWIFSGAGVPATHQSKFIKRVLMFDAVIASGSKTFNNVYWGALPAPDLGKGYTIKNGANVIDLGYCYARQYPSFNSDISSDSVITISNIRMMETAVDVVNTKSVIYMTVDNNKLVINGFTNDGSVGREISKAIVFAPKSRTNNMVRLDNVLIKDSDITYLEANPEALFEMWFGKTHTGLSFTKADMTSFFPMMENGGSTLYDITQNNVIGPDIYAGSATFAKPLTATPITNGYKIVRAAHGDPAGSGNFLMFNINTPLAKDEQAIVTFDVTYHSGNVTFDIYYDGLNYQLLPFGYLHVTKHMTEINTLLGIPSKDVTSVAISAKNNSNAYEIDITNIKVKKFTTPNSIRGNAFTWRSQIPAGAQLFLVKANKESGLITGLAKSGTIEGGSHRYIKLPVLNLHDQKHLVTKCLKEIKGDITQVVDIECTP